jgi:hypothetical protein
MVFDQLAGHACIREEIKVQWLSAIIVRNGFNLRT